MTKQKQEKFDRVQRAVLLALQVYVFILAWIDLLFASALAK